MYDIFEFCYVFCEHTIRGQHEYRYTKCNTDIRFETDNYVSMSAVCGVWPPSNEYGPLSRECKVEQCRIDDL